MTLKSSIYRNGSLRQLLVSTVGSLVLSNCGLPSPPDISKNMGDSILALGVTPVYPLRETVRIGQIYLRDKSIDTTVSAPSYTTHDVLLNEELVEDAERRRLARYAVKSRFGASGDNLPANIDGAVGERAFYRQVKGSTLPLATFPAYTLASVDEAAVGAFVPQAVVSFFAGIAGRKSQSLRLEAAAVEVADISYHDLIAGIRTSCLDYRTALGNGSDGNSEVDSAFLYLKAQLPAPDAAKFDPYFAVIRRVYYLRGIRYVYSSTGALTAAAQVALASQLASGVTPPSLASVDTGSPGSKATTDVKSDSSAGAAVSTAPVTVNMNNGVAAAAPAKAAADATPKKAADTAGLIDQLADLKTELAGLRQSINSGTNVRIQASFGRITSRGIELTDFFDRPLAFGYEAIPVTVGRYNVASNANNASVTSGYANLCIAARGGR